MSTVKTNVIVKPLPKSNGLESANIYLMNCPVYFAVVHEPKLKYQSQEKEFSVTVFVDEATKDKLLDEVMVNKTFSQVGVSKTSKPPRRIKFALSSQTEEGKTSYDDVDGLWGFNVTKNELSKKGKKMFVNVIGKDNKAFTENVGNNSICNIKLFGYVNQDSQYVVSLDTLQVIEHVVFEGKTGSDGTVTDEVFGTYSLNKAEDSVEDIQQVTQKPVQQQQQAEEEDFSDIPF